MSFFPLLSTFTFFSIVFGNSVDSSSLQTQIEREMSSKKRRGEKENKRPTQPSPFLSLFLSLLAHFLLLESVNTVQWTSGVYSTKVQ